MSDDGPPSGSTPYRAYGQRSAAVIGVYGFLLLLLLYFSRTAGGTASPDVGFLLIAVTLFFLLRYLLTQYRLDGVQLVAWRPLGARRVPLESVRRIEYANLRDLGPIGMFASWGYRGRMWSPLLGPFDAIYTDSRGLLVTAGAHPLFISPKDPERFARELSRRVRSYTGPLEVDAGASPI